MGCPQRGAAGNFLFRLQAGRQDGEVGQHAELGAVSFEDHGLPGFLDVPARAGHGYAVIGESIQGIEESFLSIVHGVVASEGHHVEPGALLGEGGDILGREPAGYMGDELGCAPIGEGALHLPENYVGGAECVAAVTKNRGRIVPVGADVPHAHQCDCLLFVLNHFDRHLPSQLGRAPGLSAAVPS
ncbi:MAG: hypothetical protein QGH97_12285 [Dehalococcoidia bacterium]|nr:hypothetical protein [Dehalococcoidia bacterium]